MPGSKSSNTLEENTFAASFVLLELRGTIRKSTCRRETANQQSDYRIVNKTMCFLVSYQYLL